MISAAGKHRKSLTNTGEVRITRTRARARAGPPPGRACAPRATAPSYPIVGPQQPALEAMVH